MAQDQPEIGVLLWQIVSPFLILVGTFGNVLSIAILNQKRFQKQPSTTLLLGLSVADLCMLYVGLLRQWVKYVFAVDFRDISEITCKIHGWLIYVIADCTVWILVAVTTERIIVTLRPFSSKRICTKNLSIISLITIVISAMVINLHVLIGYELTENAISNLTNTTVICGARAGAYENFFDNIWSWIDLCKFSIIPFIVLSSGNICIVYKLMQSKKRVSSQITPGTTQNANQNNKTSSLTLLLLTLNAVFIVCTLPICIYLIGRPYWLPKDHPDDLRLKDPWWAVVNLLMYTNNTCNFLLYCLMGSRFRDEAKNIMNTLRTSIFRVKLARTQTGSESPTIAHRHSLTEF
ncbi:tachykinin-like peptides receptor 99D [Mya arenaria]|uniref:tachykinin-like peptides receptor 99D n=1 Tax=Mya arenaria TaxID=6604 RepID=UPI0022E830A3|nr:tachykinin-like peptides receptor 99D [Mya arenaria]